MLKGLIEKLFSPRFLRFALVGAIGVPVNLGLLWLLADRLRMPLLLSSAIAIEVSIIVNFLLNNFWTFKDKNENASGGFGGRLIKYNLVSLVGLGIQVGTLYLLTSIIQHLLHLSEPGVWKYPAQLAGIGVAMGWNFFSNFFWTWAQAQRQETPT